VVATLNDIGLLYQAPPLQASPDGDTVSRKDVSL